MAIKEVLREELRNSLKMRKVYESELRKLPVGSLVLKNIKGHQYYYIVLRENGRVRFIYKGKNVDKKEIEKYRQAKKQRAQYRKLLSQAKRQIKYLRGVVRGKSAI